MALAERPSGKSERTDFSYLRYMRGVREALEAQVTKEYGTFGLGRLGQASSEVQKRVIEGSFEAARVEYEKPPNPSRDKLVQLEEVKKAFEEGRLTLTELLEGLGLKTPVESGRGGFLGWIKGSLKL